MTAPNSSTACISPQICLEGWKKKHSGAFLEEALACLHVPVSPPQSNTIASNAEAQPFVVSLCGHIDKGVHWLHYGLAGKGVALGFTTSDSIVVPPFRLLRVEYTRQKQEKQIAGLFKRIQSFVGDKPNSRGRDKVGALIFATLMRILAAGLKDKSFSEEEEWRLVTTSISRIEEPITNGEGCPPAKISSCCWPSGSLRGDRPHPGADARHQHTRSWILFTAPSK